MKDYLVVIKEDFVRDAQCAPASDSSQFDDDWFDYQGELTVDTFRTESEEEALRLAAVRVGISADMLSAYALESITQKEVSQDVEHDLIGII